MHRTIASSILGDITVCQGQNGVTYTVPLINNATSYVWSLPYEAFGTSTTDSIIVNYSDFANSGSISVYGKNACGNGASSSFAVTVNPEPISAVNISGLNTIPSKA